jgi:hypothetical protein
MALFVGTQKADQQELFAIFRGKPSGTSNVRQRGEVGLGPISGELDDRNPIGRFFGNLAQTIGQGFRRFTKPIAAIALGATLALASGCATMHGNQSMVTAPAGIQQQVVIGKVDLNLTKQILEARGDDSALGSLLRGVDEAASVRRILAGLENGDQAISILDAKMKNPRDRADLEGLGRIDRVIRLLQMETNTRNFATPVISVYVESGEAIQTEFGGKWDEDKNRAWTFSKLGPGGTVDLLLLCPVSGHAKDHYPDELYQKHTKHQSAPANDHARMRANAEIYSHNNSQYIYLTDDPSSYGMGKIVAADVKADGRYVTPVRVRLSGLEAGKTYEVRWSPFVGSDPNNPTVTHHGFKNGRSFRLIIPANVTIAQR